MDDLSTSLDTTVAALSAHRPRRLPLAGRMRTAAVAVILRAQSDDRGSARAGTELLLIRRPRRHGDRWSGNLALPGGLSDVRDEGTVATARREAEEEVGLHLGPPIGRLGDLLTAQPGRPRPLLVVPHVFLAPAGAVVVPDAREVDAYAFVALGALGKARESLVRKRIGPLPMKVPAIELPLGTLWGLTLMMVRELRRVAEG